MDLHHPPCRRFRANQTFYVCGRLAQLLLRAVQYRLLPVAARRHGLLPLIRHLVRTVARLVRAGRRWRLDFANTNFRLDRLMTQHGRPTVYVAPSGASAARKVRLRRQATRQRPASRSEQVSAISHRRPRRRRCPSTGECAEKPTKGAAPPLYLREVRR